MKRIIIALMCVLAATAGYSQTAKQILDKTAANVSAKSGATAFFVMKGKYGNTAGTISIKGKKFMASTPDAKTWYDGKNQWTYMASSEEVNVTTPTQAQQQMMNPYRFINLYNMGYDMTSKTVGSGYEVHLVANNPQRTITEMYITVNSQYIPTNVKMKTSKGWSEIAISNFKKAKISDSVFRFNAKDFPNAEVIDLR
ncbi:MAG: cell envelope biogenesis protein LolA [Prevotella sp.]|nr:cell envelope biogenesis protein LolA [Prevotella sp.]